MNLKLIKLKNEWLASEELARQKRQKFLSMLETDKNQKQNDIEVTDTEMTVSKTPSAVRQAKQLLREADGLEEQVKKLRNEATELLSRKAAENIREQNDRLINKKQVLALLWFDYYSTLTSWERKVNPLGYLEFTDNKILRSEVLRFIDDYSSGIVHEKLRRIE